MSENITPALAAEHISKMCAAGDLHTLGIIVTSPGSIGGTPLVTVESVHAGFDWNMGKVLLQPSQPLTALTADDVAAIRKSVRLGQSWHAYQDYVAHKNEVKALKDQIADLSRQLAELRTGASP